MGLHCPRNASPAACGCPQDEIPFVQNHEDELEMRADCQDGLDGLEIRPT